jgi:hypothetical protein
VKPVLPLAGRRASSLASPQRTGNTESQSDPVEGRKHSRSVSLLRVKDAEIMLNFRRGSCFDRNTHLPREDEG